MSNVAEKREWKKIAPGIYLVGKEKVVYFRQMVDGKRKTEKAALQGAAAVGGNGRPSAELNKLFRNWSLSLVNERYYKTQEGQKVPSFQELIDLYERFAPLEYAKSGRPGPKAQETAVKFFKYLVEKTGHALTEKCSTMTTGAIDNAIASWLAEGKAKATAKSYAASAQSLTARWAIPKYEEEGFSVKPYDIPMMKNLKAPRYSKPSDETIAKMDALYESLWHEKMERRDYEIWFFATMVFKFEMRPGDTALMTAENFPEHNGLHYLSYSPNKLKNSSMVHVNWPVHPDYWKRIEECFEALGAEGDKLVIGDKRKFEEQFNRMIVKAIPEIAAENGKRCYEFRKLDMHRTFHKFGAEKVAAKSGDDIKTITYYYADISWVDVSKIDLDDLK